MEPACGSSSRSGGGLAGSRRAGTKSWNLPAATVSSPMIGEKANGKQGDKAKVLLA